MSEERLRTCTYWHRFRERLAGIEPDVRRTDEFLEAAEWQPIRGPRSGFQVGANLWRKTVHAAANIPAVNLYYSFSDDEVAFLWTERVEWDSVVVGSIPINDLPF